MQLKIYLRTSVLAVSLTVLAGCATVGPNQNVFYGTGQNFRMNGALFTELQANSLGAGVTRLTVKSKADAAAMDDLIIYYTRSAMVALDKKDIQLFSVNWFIAKKLAAARLEQLAGAQSFRNALYKNRNGTASLPAGGRVFLPNTLFDEKTPAKRAALDFEVDIASPLASVADWSAAVKVAAVGDALRGLLAGVETVGNVSNMVGGGGDRLTHDQVDQMKTGSTYAVSDSNGNKFILEKTPDGMVIHNPDSKPALIDLKKIDFMPLLERPSATRINAGRIVANLNRALDDGIADTARRNNGRVENLYYHTLAPNQLILGDRRAYITADGRATSIDDPAVRARYKTDPAFKYAIDLNTRDDLDHDPLYREMQSVCESMLGREYYGEGLDHVRYTCRRADRTVTYSRTYVIGNDYKTQSWDSIADDKRYRDTLDQADKTARLVEALTAFLPLVGNVDAAMRCGDSSSLSYLLGSQYFGSNINQDVRKAVKFVPEADNPSLANQALDCAQGVGALGAVRRVATAGSKALRWDNLTTTDAYKDTTALMNLMDSRIHDGSNIDQLMAEVKRFSSPDAALVAKLFYDGVQTTNDLSGLAERVVKKIL